MRQHEQVAEKIQTLPEPLLREVEDFIDFLLVRYRKASVKYDDLSSEAMTRMVAEGRAFDWLADPVEEGLYSDADGEPV